MYDAESIELAFSALTGEGRTGLDGFLDADVFRLGKPKDIGQLLQKATDVLERRIASIRFEPGESEPGKPQARLNQAVESLRQVAADMQEMDRPEPEDYHWILVGHLVHTIAALLNLIEDRIR